MKTTVLLALTALMITPSFGDDIIKLNDFTREDEVYIQRGYSEVQGTCALMAIHEVFDYGMEADFSILFIRDEIAVVNAYSTGTVCTPTEMETVRDGLVEYAVKHEEMCYFNETC